MAEAVQKCNEVLDGQDKLLQKSDKKFENKVSELISQKISIYEVELSTILTSLETSCTNVTLLFGKLWDISSFTKEIKDNLFEIDEDLKASAQQLHLEPSSSSTHFKRIRFLIDMQTEFLREEARIISTLVDIQNMILPNMDALQKHIAYSKTLIHDNNFSISDHMIELSAEV